MRFEAGRSTAEYLSDLRAAAEATWGPARFAELEAPLEVAADALWRLSQAPLGFLEQEPDFIGGAGHLAEAAHD